MELMSSVSLTVMLSGFIFAICIFAAWSRRGSLISAVNIFLLLNVIAFGVRPLLSASEGGYFHYDIPNPIVWSDYNFVLACQLIFTCSYLIVYLAFTRDRIPEKSASHTPPTAVDVSWAALIIAFSIGTISLGAIHILSNGAWLPGDRTGSISSVVPFGKILFPLVDLPLSFVIPMSFCIALRSSPGGRLVATLFILAATVEISLVYQRGFLIYSLATILFVCHRLRGSLPLRIVVPVVGAGLLVLFAMRPLVDMVSPNQPPKEARPYEGFIPLVKSNLLFTENFDLPDVFVITKSYVDQNGLLWGKSFISDFARVLPPAIRNDLHIETITDTINIYYWGDVYLDSHIGLAIYVPHVLYANFGLLGMFLGALPGYATARLDNWLARVRVFTPQTVAFVYAALFVNGFFGEEAGDLQWGGTACLIGIAIQKITQGMEKPRGATEVAEDRAWV